MLIKEVPMKTLVFTFMLLVCSFQRLHKNEYPIQKYGAIKQDSPYQYKKCGDYFAWREKDKTLAFKILVEETGIKINGEESGVLNVELPINRVQVELDNTRAFPSMEISKKHPPVIILISIESYQAAGCLPKLQQ
jgi:hypothetical protein